MHSRSPDLGSGTFKFDHHDAAFELRNSFLERCGENLKTFSKCLSGSWIGGNFVLSRAAPGFNK